MATKKKLLEAAAGAGGVDALSLDNLSWQGTGDIPFTWLGGNLSQSEVMTYGDSGNKAYILGQDNDGSKIVRQFSLSTAYDPETIDLYNPTDFDPSTYAPYPVGLEFKPDGTKMFIVCLTNKNITEWTLSTAWDISTATYYSSFTLNTTYNTNPRNLSFDNIGRYVFVVDIANNPDQIITYELSVNYQIATATFYSNHNVVGTTGTNSTRDIAWGDNGDKFYMPFAAGDGVQIGTVNASSSPYQVGSVGAGSIINLDDETNTPQSTFVRSQNGSNLYTYCTSYERVVLHNESGAKYPTSDFLSVKTTSSDSLNLVDDIAFSPSGHRLYAVAAATDTIYEYTLSTNFDLSTATYSTKFLINADETAPKGITVSSDGFSVYMTGTNNDTIYRYNMTTAWDLSTVNTTAAESLDVSSLSFVPAALNMSSDDTELFVQGYYGQVVKISLASAKTLSGATLPTLPKISVAINLSGSIETNPCAVFFKTDGTKMFFAGATNDRIYAMDLSTAWDVSTATYNNEQISVAGDEANPTGLFFKPDGTAMFFVGTGSDTIWEYTLNTAWDLSSSQGSGRTLSVSAQDGAPEGLFFKSDGTEVYICGNSNNTVEQYSMSTAWRLNTATHTNTLNVFTEGGIDTPFGVSFKSDGTKMYVLDDGEDIIKQYSLSTAWDISTATYDNKFGYQRSENVSVEDLYMKSDGTKVYIIGRSTDAVFEYDLSTAYDISTMFFDAPSDSYLDLVQLSQYNPNFPGPSSSISFGGSFDGSGKNYFAGSTGNIHRFKLPTAYSFTGATYEETKTVPYSPVYAVNVAGDDSQLYMTFAGSKGGIFAFTFG